MVDCRHMNTVGFADSKAIWLNDCDVAEPLSDKRLSWFVDEGWGGYRVGRHMDLYDHDTLCAH